MQDQKFCTFLYLDGVPDGDDAGLLRDLPSATGNVTRHGGADWRLYVSPGAGNPLHRNHAAFAAGHVVFLQGEFYEDTDPAVIEGVVTAEGPDPAALCRVLAGLNGVFSGFIARPGTGRVWGFNDRFGMGHAYVTVAGGATLVSSNLWPALRFGRSGWNAEALQEILMFGYPLRDGTPLDSTRIVQPGLVLVHDDAGFGSRAYFDYGRIDDDRRRDFVGEFRAAARSHFDSVGSLTGWRAFGSTLSGGHDSRVVVNAMLASGIRPNCYVGFDRFPTWDAKRGARVAALGRLHADVIDYQVYSEQDGVDTNVLADGSGTGSWSMNLAKASADRDDCIYFGTSGDPVSGGWKVFPREYADVPSLAKAMMKAYYHEYSTPQAEFMGMFADYPGERLMAKFTDSFAGGPDIVAAFLINFYREGNFRRVRMFMQGAYMYSSPVHFFHDLRIYDFYSRLPYRVLLGQRVHNRLCSFASPAMALVPATNFPVPVALETWLLPLAKRAVSYRLRSKLRPMTRKAVLGRVPIAEDVLERLDGHVAATGIDPGRLREIASADARSGALALRSRYVADMLEPRGLLDRSRLVGTKRIIIAGT